MLKDTRLTVNTANVDAHSPFTEEQGVTVGQQKSETTSEMNIVWLRQKEKCERRGVREREGALHA